MSTTEPPVPPPPPPRPEPHEARSSGLLFGPGPGRTVPPLPLEDASFHGIQVLNQGARYVLGRYKGVLAIWDLHDSRTCIVWFPAKSRLEEDRARMRWDTLEHGGIPFWRRATAVWILTHVLLGFIVGAFAVNLVAHAVAGVAGINPTPRPGNEALLNIAWASGLAGWIAFVYLRTSLLVRTLALAGLWAMGVVAWMASYTR